MQIKIKEKEYDINLYRLFFGIIGCITFAYCIFGLWHNLSDYRDMALICICSFIFYNTECIIIEIQKLKNERN